MNTRRMTTVSLLALAALAAAGAAFGQGAGRRPALLNRGPGAARPGGAAGAAAAPSADEAAAAIKNAPKGTNGVPALVFNQAPLELVLDAYAEQCGKTIIPAPDLPKTTITLRSLEGQTLTKTEYMEAIELTLTQNGVVLEPYGAKFLRALQRKTVRTQGIPIRMAMPKEPLPEKGRVVSQMIRLENITAEEAQKAIEGFKDPNGLLQVFERTNTILVTDTQENINRMLEVIKELDVATPVTEDVFVREIKFALASEIKTALETIVTESQKDAPKETSGAKTSGGLGFGKTAAPAQPSRLPNLNNRPGQPKPEPAPATPNANLVAAVSDADRGMIRGKVLILADDRANKLIVITAATNMKFFDKVIDTLDVETTPEVSVEVIRLKYADSEEVASMLNDLIGNNNSSSTAKNNQNANASKTASGSQNLTRGGAAGGARPQTANPTFSKSASASLGELNKDNIKILADKRINGIVIMARRADLKAVKEVIEDMDVKLSQVLIETVIIEVTLGDELTTGIDWVQRGKYRTTVNHSTENGFSTDKYYLRDSNGNLTSVAMSQADYDAQIATLEEGAARYGWTLSDVFQKVATTARDGFLNHGGNTAGYMLGGGGGNTDLANLAGSSVTASPIGSGLNYLLKSDRLNLAAIIQATKIDNRAKYIASPIIMTVDNKEATIDATENRQFVTGWTAQSGSYGNSGTPTPNYTAKDIGIKIKVTPKINPNGTVMLTVEEEYTQYVKDGQSMLIPGSSTSSSSSGSGESSTTEAMSTQYTKGTVDLAVERKMSADVILDNRQTIILGGLTETSTSESETGIPILKDIPWIGKWLFSSVSQSESRKELLVFMTPYVLDDADAAQAESFRRKRSLSDPSPWDDHGWSASPLADPVSKKEQLRRFNDEWKRQDEERKTQLAIEKAKMERVKKLKEMSESERKAWLEIHKDDLEKEEKEAFEKQAQEQKDLREFVEELKKKDLEKADAAIQDAADGAAQDNEYRKFIRDAQSSGKPLPAGETLRRDAEALSK